MTQKIKRYSIRGMDFVEDPSGGICLPEEVDAYVSELEDRLTRVTGKVITHVDTEEQLENKLKEARERIEELKILLETAEGRIEIRDERIAYLEADIRNMNAEANDVAKEAMRQFKEKDERIAELEREACEDYEEILRLRGASEIQADLMRGKERLIEELKGKAQALDRLMNNELIRLGEYAMLPEREYEELKRKAAAFDRIEKEKFSIAFLRSSGPNGRWDIGTKYGYSCEDTLLEAIENLKAKEQLKESE